MKCLVIDDSTITRRIIIISLRAIGFTEILEAADGQQALAVCTPDVDVVLTDWTMPGMQGVDVLRSLRARPELASIPVLLITSRSAREDVAEAVAAGIDGYVMKPFTADELKAKILKVVGPRESTGTEG